MHRGEPGGGHQRGVTLIGLLFWAIVIGFVALRRLMRVLPTLNEYFTIQARSTRSPTEGRPRCPRSAPPSSKQKDIEYSITSITGKDLEVTKENDKVVDPLRLRQGNRAVRPGLPADQVRGPIALGHACRRPRSRMDSRLDALQQRLGHRFAEPALLRAR